MLKHLALAAFAGLVGAQSIQVSTISVAIPSTVFAVPVVYVTYSGAQAATATTVAAGATGVSDPMATNVFSNAAAASSALSALQKRDQATICPPQPSGITYSTSPDTPAAFVADSYYSAQASQAPVPSGYLQTFSNLLASNSATKYMGYTLLSSYNSTACATKCSAITGCNSFNLYFERDPSVDPNSDCCANPSSVTNVKCVFWGDAITSANANNYGQWRNQFDVVIAGSNGYVNITYLQPVVSSSSTSSTMSSTMTTMATMTSSTTASTATCTSTYSRAGGIQVWNPVNFGNVNTKWLQLATPTSSSSPASFVLGNVNAASNGTSFFIDTNPYNGYLVQTSGSGCGKQMSIDITQGAKAQQPQWVPSSTTSATFPLCSVRSSSDWMVICGTVKSGVVTVWQAMVCQQDNYQNLWWNTGAAPSGCAWVGLYYHAPANPWAAS